MAGTRRHTSLQSHALTTTEAVLRLRPRSPLRRDRFQTVRTMTGPALEVGPAFIGISGLSILRVPRRFSLALSSMFLRRTVRDHDRSRSSARMCPSENAQQPRQQPAAFSSERVLLSNSHSSSAESSTRLGSGLACCRRLGFAHPRARPVYGSALLRQLPGRSEPV